MFLVWFNGAKELICHLTVKGIFLAVLFSDTLWKYTWVWALERLSSPTLRVTESWMKSDCKIPGGHWAAYLLVARPASKLGEVAQGLTWLSFENHPGLHCPRHQFQCIITFMMKFSFLISRQSLPYCSLHPFPLTPFPVHLQKESGSFSPIFHMVVEDGN